MSTFRYATRCAALLGLCLPCAAIAQTTPTPADMVRFYRRHLGLTASPVLNGFFRNNCRLPLGLLLQATAHACQSSAPARGGTVQPNRYG